MKSFILSSIVPAIASTMVLTTGFLVCGCSTAPTTVSAREDLHGDASATLQRMYAVDPGLQTFLQQARGYVIFPTVGKGAVVAGGAYGRGQVYEQGQFIGYADISQATIGAQVGGQSYTEIIAFESPGSLEHFKAGQLTFDASASAVAMKSGAAETANYSNGVAVFVAPIGGLMVEAAIGGQTFSFQPSNDNVAPPVIGSANTGN
jgi:lipid-binding SYLF domain-containing protein